MRITALRALVVAVVTVASITGCAPAAPESELPPATIATDEPTTETTGPPPDDGGDGDDDVAIELAQLPIGGGSSPDAADPARQCVDVSWIAQSGDGIPEGIAISVTGATFTPPIFDIVDGCSGGAPACLGYTFDTTAQNCTLAVVGNGAVFDSDAPDRPTVSLAGSVECTAPESEECAAFVAAAQGDPNVAIQLDFPPEGGTPPDDGTDGDTGDPTDTGTDE